MLPVFLLAIHQIKYSEYITSINQPIRELLTTSKFSDVQFVVHNPNANKSEIIDEIYRTVSEISPTSCVCLNGSNTSLFRVSRETLMVYIYFSESSPDVRRSEEITDVIVQKEARQKVLLITVLEESDCDFESVLARMWRKQLLNVAILELPKFGEDRAVMVHRYNPFSNVYDRRAYTPGFEWFPDKLRNLHGYALRIMVFSRPGVVNVTTDSRDRVARISGPDAKVLEVLARVMNFTPDVQNAPMIESSLQEIMVANNVDMTLVSIPIFDDETASLTEYSLPLSVESWCPVVPINYPFAMIETRAVIGITVNCVIVSVFWAVSHVLKFDQKCWQPLKIFGMMLSMSVSMKPKRTIEKIFLLGIFLVSSFVSTNLYADLTTSNLKGKSRTIYNDFKELDNSGLIPVVMKPLYNITFSIEDQSFVALKKKTLLTHSTSQCAHRLAKYKNITCFMEESLADMMIYSYKRKGKKNMMVCRNLCYSKPPVGYLIKKHSAFVERISGVTIRLQVSGIRDKWIMDYIGKFSPRKTHFIRVNQKKKSKLVRNLIPIGLCGCLLSLLVFCAEIMLGRIENNEEE